MANPHATFDQVVHACKMAEMHSSIEALPQGYQTEIGERGATRECVVRNISEKGANLEFSNVIKLPKEKISLTIARKGRSFLATIIWWRDNFVGVAFRSDTSSQPVSDLAERLRESGKKKRQLQRRIKELIGEG